jgi:hypothetical protein
MKKLAALKCLSDDSDDDDIPSDEVDLDEASLDLEEEWDLEEMLDLDDLLEAEDFDDELDEEENILLRLSLDCDLPNYTPAEGSDPSCNRLTRFVFLR